MILQVSEINQNGPQHGPTATTTSISIFVTDENDNLPTINMASFRAYIDDSAQLNYPIQFQNDTEIVIEDKDQVCVSPVWKKAFSHHVEVNYLIQTD